jgi:hypothetical protein
MATSCERADAHTTAGPVDDVHDATLEVASGTDAITVRSEDLGDDLYRISTPDGSVAPAVEREDGGDDVMVRVRLVDDDDADDDADRDVDRAWPPWDDDDPNDRWSEGRGGDRDDEMDDDDGTDDDGIDDDAPAGDDATMEIRLNSQVRWTLRLAGGSDTATIDMRAGGLAGVEFAAGVSHIQLSLPAPDGTVAVRMLAGASEFDMTAPSGVPARVRLGSGAGSVTVDGSTRTGVAQGTVLTPPSWDSASDRYDIDASAGVSRLTLARH